MALTGLFDALDEASRGRERLLFPTNIAYSLGSKCTDGRLTPAESEVALKPLRAVLGSNAPKITVVQSESDLPAAYREEIRKAQAEGEVEGFYDAEAGIVYIIADRHRNAEALYRTALEEVMGHAGLRGVLGNKVQRNKILGNKALSMSLENGFPAQQHNAAAQNVAMLWKHAEFLEETKDKNNDPNIIRDLLARFG